MSQRFLHRTISIVAVAAFATSCGSGSDELVASTSVPTVSFCDAAKHFGRAQRKGPDAETPQAVQQAVVEITQAIDELVAAAPTDAKDSTHAFATAMATMMTFIEQKDFNVDLGGSAEIWQSGEGATLVNGVVDTIGPVDKAVQDQCDRYLSDGE
jgi:hypothetical protein